MQALDTDTFILLDLELEEPIMCESYYENVEKNMRPHEAHWYAASICGSVTIAVCERRRHLAFVSDGWRCTPNGCDAFHHYCEIHFTPITGGHHGGE